MPTDYDKIREDNIREYGEGTRHLSFLGRLYTDRTHFVFELLQNAEDAGATRILFNLFDDRLEVTHDGRLFNERDVRGVCGVGEGTKAEDLTQIGKFGIGFKSVYAYTATPEIHSAGECFTIKHYVRPYAVPPKKAGNSWTTLFVFPFNAEEITPETACQEIGDRLQNLSARTLLFLREINEIEYKLPNSTGGAYLREEIKRGSARQVSVIGHNNGQEEEENWLVFERPVAVPGNSKEVRVEVSFLLESEDDSEQKKERIIKIKSSPLVVYFPTEKETRFGFLVQGPYRTTPSRDNIPKDDDWNKTLINETSRLLEESLREIKNLDLLTVSFLEALPIKRDDFSETSMFYPIFHSVRESLKKEDLLPSADGFYVSAKNSKISRVAELRSLISQQQLQQLFQSQDPIKWLTGEITQDRTPDLRIYLLNELKIEEVTPEGFARGISGPFLHKQSDEWMIALYTYFGPLKALWRPGYDRNPWGTAGPLRSKNIIRLENGTQVPPFRSDGSPNAYLVDTTDTKTSLPHVKIAISQNEDAFSFLKQLGIPELDLVAEVIENVLPKYSDDPSKINNHEHRHDMSKIVKAYATDSREKKSRLREQLLETPFVRMKQNIDALATYRCPGEIYFSSNYLEQYFLGDEKIAFVFTGYSPTEIELLKELGVADSIRVVRKKPNKQGFVIIKDCHGCHERGLLGFDPDIHIDGLENALASPTLEKSQFIWNSIAVLHSDCIRGTIESSSRQYYEGSKKNDFISVFGKLLIETSWLPDIHGFFKKPGDLTLYDLPITFVRDERLAQQLGMKLDVVAKLAVEAGVSAADIDLVRGHPEEFKKWKASLVPNLERPPFPTRSVVDTERRMEHLGEQLSNAPEKEYEKRERSIRTTNGAIDPTTWLRNQYTNKADQMVCQICKEEMPFRKRDGAHYFEKKEVLSKKYLPKEHEAQYLALCPLCAAKYDEFVKTDDQIMVELMHVIVNSDNCEIPISLGDEKTSIRFVETHYHDLKAIIDQ